MTIVALIFIASTLYNLFSFPFSPADPLKVAFKQTVDLDAGTNRVFIDGVPKYLRHHIVNEIPSANGHVGVWCSDHGIRPLLSECRYSGPMPAVAGPNTKLSDLITHSAKRTGGRNSTLAQFRVSGKDTRACRIYLDSSPAINVHVHGSSRNGKTQPGYDITDRGISVIKLWSRTWDREWVVDVDLGKNSSETVSGRVACEWSENSDSRIPALEEVMTFVPKWVAVTKADDGLVEAWYKFNI